MAPQRRRKGFEREKTLESTRIGVPGSTQKLLATRGRGAAAQPQAQFSTVACSAADAAEAGEGGEDGEEGVGERSERVPKVQLQLDA